MYPAQSWAPGMQRWVSQRPCSRGVPNGVTGEQGTPGQGDECQSQSRVLGGSEEGAQVCPGSQRRLSMEGTSESGSDRPAGGGQAEQGPP